MATRTPIISIVEIHNYISWQFTPDEVEYFFERYGVENTKRIMRSELEKAMERAEWSFRHFKTVTDPEIICQDACYISEEDFYERT